MEILREAIGCEDLLAEARSEIHRLTPAETVAAVEEGAVLVDIRPVEQRIRDGLVPAAHVIERNVLEWRLDPRGAHRDPAVADQDRQVILICDEGYQSSLAAANLRRLGLDAADVIGGVRAWRRAALAMEIGEAAKESNLPSGGLHRPAGFEGQMGHQTPAAP
jgi:rhodanese-related sulfurtransferase